MTTSPGTEITRRAALRVSSAAAACLVGATAPRARARPGQEDGFTEFCARWLEIAEDYIDRSAAGVAADEYLFRLCAALVRLGPDRIPGRQRTTWEGNGLRTGPVWGRGEIFVLELQLAPGAELKAHNHPAFNAVTMVASGDCMVRHLEPVGEAPDYRTRHRESFPLQETRAGLLKTGRVSHLSRSRDNIHWFQAGDEGATLVDFSMAFGGDPGDFSALELDPEPIDAARRIYEGFWIGNPYR